MARGAAGGVGGAEKERRGRLVIPTRGRRFDGRFARANQTAGCHARVPMTDTLRDLLLKLPRSVDPQLPVLPQWNPANLTVAFGRLVRSLGIKNLTFHDLRHDAASTLTMAGVPQRTIMAILGHRDPRMTLRYQHLSPGICVWSCPGSVDGELLSSVTVPLPRGIVR